jgi:hypothetical protein
LDRPFLVRRVCLETPARVLQILRCRRGLGPCHGRWRGNDLHANVSVPARDRARLERLCRYALRPPVAQDRLHLTPEGGVVLELRHQWADGTRHLAFEPLELLERLAALTPRPRINLVLSYGVLGARSAWRARMAAPLSGRGKPPLATRPAPDTSTDRPRTNRLWAELMQRSFGCDVLACPRCGGRLELIALIEDSRVIRRILNISMCPRMCPRRVRHGHRHCRSRTPIRGTTTRWPRPERDGQTTVGATLAPAGVRLTGAVRFLGDRLMRACFGAL